MQWSTATAQIDIYRILFRWLLWDCLVSMDKTRSTFYCAVFVSTVCESATCILIASAKPSSSGRALKVHKHDIFFYFFAETESLWSQGPVTRDFDF